MKKTMKQIKTQAAEIKANCTFIETTGNETWQNNFYRGVSGMLFNIQYKNGKLFDVICYGR